VVRAVEDGVTTGGAEQRLKVPPHSIEAEQSLLGGLMLDHQSWDKIADVVSEQDFYRKLPMSSPSRTSIAKTTS
jgi:replicative DNA helicase